MLIQNLKIRSLTRFSISLRIVTIPIGETLKLRCVAFEDFTLSGSHKLGPQLNLLLTLFLPVPPVPSLKPNQSVMNILVMVMEMVTVTMTVMTMTVDMVMKNVIVIMTLMLEMLVVITMMTMMMMTLLITVVTVFT